MLRFTRLFSRTTALRVQAGDAVPKVALFEHSPKDQVDLAGQLGRRSLIIGVPGAYSGGCTQTHIPGYLTQLDRLAAHGVHDVFVVAVNDAFVVDAWAKDFQKDFDTAGVRFLADPKGEFAAAWDVLFDGSAFFGNSRSKRYAALVEDGKVKQAFVEPDNTSVDVSAAAKVIAALEQ